MKDFFETTVGRVVLLIIVAVIWGVNAFQFSDVFTSEEKVGQETSSHINVTDISKASNNPFRYRKTTRNPFNSAIKPIPSTFLDSANVSVYQPPRIAVLGVMDETIMVIDESRKIIVVKETEIFNGITVTKITPDSVIFEYENKPFVIKVKS